VQDRRQAILTAGIEILREEGYSAFTQPRVAKRAGLRQSLLTYYFPTRVNLIAAVARVAIDGQLAAIDTMLSGRQLGEAGEVLAAGISRHDNTRILMALAQAADQESELQLLFRELSEGILTRVQGLLVRNGAAPNEAVLDLVHATSVGLAVIDLATSRPNGQERSRAALELLFALLSERQTR